MPSSDRPRTTIEALFEPLIRSDNGEQGIGPTLGEDVGAPPSASSRAAGEGRSFSGRRSMLASTTARAPLGSEIFRAGRGFRAGVLRPPSLSGESASDQARPPGAKGGSDSDDGL